MYDLVMNNYENLFKNYCKYQDKNKITNAHSCADLFNDKILYFMELKIQNPTIELLNTFLKTKIKNKNSNTTIQFKDYMVIEESESEIELKLKFLFIDYRSEKNIDNANDNKKSKKN